MNPIEILPYHPSWPEMAKTQIETIKSHLGKACIDIYHVGSTAVPGLAAKEVLDIVLVVDALNHGLPLQKIGYTFKGQYNIPLRYYFSKHTVPSKVNLHVCEPGHGFIGLSLTFRDWLRHHDADRKAYEALKYRILKSPDAGVKSREGFTNYNRSKNNFIKSILKKAGYAGTIVNCCLHDAEWESAKTFRNKYFFKRNKIEDPYAWTFDHKDHQHFIFYEGVDPVGYAHLQLCPDNQAALRMIVIDEQYQGKGHAKELIALIETYLTLEGYKRIAWRNCSAHLKG